MAHGTKDYGNVQQKETTYRLDDMAELAIRLRALPSLDRLGDVIFQEDFSNGIYNWTQEIGGTGAAISLSTTHFKSGGFAAKLMAGSTLTRKAMLIMFFPYPVLSIFGLECCMTIGDDVELAMLLFEVLSGGTAYQAYIIIDPVNDKLSYLASSGAWIDFVSSANLTTDDYIYNSFKLVIDLETKKYKRFCYNSGVATMEGLDLYSYVTTDPNWIRTRFQVWSKSGLNGICYLDNVIITQNEP